MLFILRQLRRLELRQKSGRYFLYALGEIVLIVIGILIALQIQTWNENRKLGAYEITMLQEIGAALVGDRARIDNSVSLLGRLERKEAAVEALLSFAEEGVDPPKEEFFHYFRRLIHDIAYRYNGGPFDALKSAGFERISNETLRRDIIREYTNFFPDMRASLEAYNRKMEERSRLYYSDLFRPELTTQGDETGIAPTKIIVDTLITHPSFLYILNFERWKAQEQRYVLDLTIERIEALKAQIDAELERLTGEPVKQQSDE